MNPGRAAWVFAAGAMSLATSHRLVNQRLNELPEEQRAVIVLLTSELVTNAVRHGTGQVGVCTSPGTERTGWLLMVAAVGIATLSPIVVTYSIFFA